MERPPQHASAGPRRVLGMPPLAAKIILPCAFAVLLVVIVYGFSIVRMMFSAGQMESSAQDLANAALGCGTNGTSLVDSAKSLEKSTRALRGELDSPIWDPVVNYLPFGSDIGTMRTLLASADQLTSGPLNQALSLADQVSSFGAHKRVIDARVVLKLPGLVKTTRADLSQQVEALSAVKPPQTSAVKGLLTKTRSVLQQVDDQLGTYQDAVDILPQLLGSGQERTYLLFVYNPAEIRSGGGMIGNVAALTAKDGKVTIGSFSSTSHNYDSNVSAFDAENTQEAKMFGDWVYQYPQMSMQNPNFPRVAVTNMNLWKYQKGHQDANVAGVIAVDPVFLQALIAATGPLTLSDGTVLTGTSTVPFFLNQLYVKHPEFSDQNAFVSNSSGAILSHVMGGSGGASGFPALLKALHDMSAAGHFKLWLKASVEQQVLTDAQLVDPAAAGALPSDPTQPVSGIYLNQYQASKLDWYARTTVKVAQVCGDQSTSTGDEDALPQSTVLRSIDSSELGDEYTVTFTVHNTLTAAEVRSLPTFVTGKRAPGGMDYRIYLMAPLHGEITSVTSATATPINNMILPDRQMVAMSVEILKPGQTTTISYTVRVPKTATTALNVVNTPVVTADGTETGSNGQVTPCGGTTGSGESASPSPSPAPTGGATGEASPSATDPVKRLQDSLHCPVDITKLSL